jgi:hypothetical protein
MVVVLGFLSRQVKIGRIFFPPGWLDFHVPEALPAKVIVRSMPGDCWIGCFQLCAPMFSI